MGQKVCKLQDKKGELLLELLPDSGTLSLGKLYQKYNKRDFIKGWRSWNKLVICGFCAVAQTPA